MPNKFHINPQTGAVSQCRAQKGGCPFASEEQHYSSIKEARQGYETMMAAQVISTVSLKELNELAKSASDENILRKIVDEGSNRTYQNLARNLNAPSEYLAEAYNATEDEKTRWALMNSKNFPAEALTVEDYGRLYNSKDWWEKSALGSFDGLTDAHVEAAGEADFAALKNVNNKLSPKIIAREAEKSSTNMIAAVEAQRYPFGEPYTNFDLVKHRSAIEKIDNSSALLSLTHQAIESESKLAYWALARNKNTPVEALSMLAEKTKDTDVLCSIYQNPNASKELKASLAEKHEVLHSYQKLERIQEEQGKSLKELIGSGAEKAATYSSQKRTIQLDAAKVKELGLTALDVDTYIRRMKGNYLFGSQYDASTGVYSGYID